MTYTYRSCEDLDANQAITLALNVASYNHIAYARKFGQQIERMLAPLLNNQAVFQFNEQGDCVGVLTWAKVTSPQLMIHANDHRALQPHEVVNGPLTFILDCYADIGDVNELLRHFSRKQDEVVKCIRNGRLETV